VEDVGRVFFGAGSGCETHCSWDGEIRLRGGEVYRTQRPTEMMQWCCCTAGVLASCETPPTSNPLLVSNLTAAIG